MPKILGVDHKWGVAGLTASAGLAGWIEFALLRRALMLRIGDTSLTGGYMLRLWAVALGSALIAYVLKVSLGGVHPIIMALLTLPLYGMGYFVGTFLLGIPEATHVMNMFASRTTKRRTY